MFKYTRIDIEKYKIKKSYIMKILRSQNTSVKKSLLIGIAILVILGLSALAYVYLFSGTLFGWSNNPQSTSSINYEPPTQEQKDEGNAAKDSFNDKYYPTADDQKDTSDDSTTPSKDVSIIISSTTQTSDAIQIRTIIQSVNSGACKLTMTKEGQPTITREAETQNLGSYSTCKGFDVPLSELQAGSWNAIVDYKNGSEAGSANQKIEVQG
jgi:cytoskeletal protein RodZ